MTDCFTQRQETVADRYLQSSYSLWSAILTVNGILLAAFSIVTTLENKVINCIVVTTTFLCVTSLILIIYNFVAIKRTYYRIGQVMANGNAEITDEQRDRDIRKALFLGKSISCIEKLCLIMLGIEAILVLVMVVYSSGFGGAIYHWFNAIAQRSA